VTTELEPGLSPGPRAAWRLGLRRPSRNSAVVGDSENRAPSTLDDQDTAAAVVRAHSIPYSVAIRRSATASNEWRELCTVPCPGAHRPPGDPADARPRPLDRRAELSVCGFYGSYRSIALRFSSLLSWAREETDRPGWRVRPKPKEGVECPKRQVRAIRPPATPALLRLGMRQNPNASKSSATTAPCGLPYGTQKLRPKGVTEKST
jgi:hypothetical protein